MDGVSLRIATWLFDPEHSKRKLAQLLSISEGTLRNKLSGHTEWTWKEIQSLAEILECKPNDLR